MTKRIIALCGQKGTGKDFVAGSIARQLNEQLTSKRIEFADPIKDIVCSAFRLRTHQDYGNFIRSLVTLEDGTKILGKDIVKSLQLRIRESFSRQFAEKIEDEIMAYKGYHPESFDNVVFIIPDLRFKEELKWLKKNNAVIVKVVRDSSTYDPSISEPDIDDYFCDYVVDNNGTEKETEMQIAIMLEQLQLK